MDFHDTPKLNYCGETAQWIVANMSSVLSNKSLPAIQMNGSITMLDLLRAKDAGTGAMQTLLKSAMCICSQKVEMLFSVMPSQNSHLS